MSGSEAGAEICLIYDKIEDRLRDLLPMILRHVSIGNRCVCVLHEPSPHQSIEILTSADPAIDDALRRGALMFISLADFAGTELPTPDDMADAIRNAANDAVNHDFAAALVIIDMDWLAANELANFDSRTFVKPSADGVSIVRLYDPNRMSPDHIQAALESHPLVQIDSHVVANPYYVSSLETSPDLHVESHVEAMLAHLHSLAGSVSAGDIASNNIHAHRESNLFPNLDPYFTASVADAVIFLDGEGTIVSLNSVAEGIWQIDPTELVGQNIRVMYPQTVEDHTYQQIQRALREKTLRRFETFSMLMNCWVELTLVPNEDHLWISVRDISRRKQIEQTLSERVRQQATVADLGQLALESTDLQTFMDTMVETVSKTLDVEFVKVLELLPGHSAFRIAAGTGWEESLIGTATVDAGLESQAGFTLQAGEPVIVENLQSETRFSGPQLLHDHQILSGMSVPIPGNSGPYGVLGVHTRKLTRFTEDDVYFVKAVANILAAAIDRERAEELHRHYSAIVSSSDDAIIAETLDGVITGWNLAAERMFGYSDEEAIGKPVTILYPPQITAEMQALLEDIRRGKKVEQLQSVRRRKDGRLIDVSISLSPIRDRRGRIIGASKTARDISARKQAEIERLALDQRLQLALEAGRMGTWDWNMGTDEVIWSTNMEQIHGLPPGSFAGTFDAFSRSIHPDDRDRVMNAIRAAMDARDDYYVEYRNVRPDGSSQWLQARGRIVPGGRGRPNHMTGICTDVTDQVESRQQIAQFAETVVAERDRLQQVIDVIPEGITITDSMGRIILSNQAARDIWGQPPSDTAVHGHASFRAEHPDGSPVELEELPTSRSLWRGERIVGEQLSLRNAASGEMVPLLINSAPIRGAEDAIVGAVTTFQDITSFKEFERQKDEFLQTVSHDLKNPLTSVKGNAQFLRRRVRRDDNRLLPIIDRIEHSVVQAVEMIDELLDLTRLQMGRPVELIRERTDLIRLIHQIAEQHAATSRFHRIQFETDIERLYGYLDEMRITRVISNLLNNAIKYSPDNSEIVIRVGQSAEAPNWVKIDIQDHGIGIPPADLPQLFERFRRGSNVEGQIRGSGLGLASSKQIVEQHGGRIEVSSVEGAGSTFRVLLPLEESPTESSPN